MKGLFLILISFTSFSYANVSNNDLSNNSVSVTSVSEILADKRKEKNEEKVNNLNNIFEKYCQQEITLFCRSASNHYNCLKQNFNLITGQCSNILKQEFGKGIIYNQLSIHDLKLSDGTKLLKTKSSINFKVATYKTGDVFDYRNIRFRKGMVQARNYRYSDYNGQYVIFSAYPKNIFIDESGIEYNPFWQKGPFFFDEKGNVKIGTLSKEFEYKPHIYLKKGSVIVFNDDRELLKGTLSRSLRVNKCGFLKNMEISDKEIEECLEK